VIRLFGELFNPEARGLSVVTVDDGIVTAIEPAASIGAVASGERVAADVLGGPRSRIVPGLIVNTGTNPVTKYVVPKARRTRLGFDLTITRCQWWPG